MTSDEALEILVVYVAMTDAQLATDCERAIKAALSASQAERERLTRERDEALTTWPAWPDWAVSIRAKLQSYGVMTDDDQGGCDLPEVFDEWVSGYAFECERRAEAAEARATRAEEEIARRDAVAKASWGDQKDQHTDAILAAHPTYTKEFETYDAALAMVGNRHGKYELVNLVNWLLARATRAEALVEEAGEVLAEIANMGLGRFGYRPKEHARAFLDKLKEQGQ